LCGRCDLRQPNAPIQRLRIGALWSEGLAWNSVGRFLMWSDIPRNHRPRYLEDDGGKRLNSPNDVVQHPDGR
jgi:sugar lactone lactonase YvrE